MKIFKSADFSVVLAKNGPSTLQNPAFDPSTAKISIWQGEEREMFDCHASCSRYENVKTYDFAMDF